MAQHCGGRSTLWEKSCFVSVSRTQHTRVMRELTFRYSPRSRGSRSPSSTVPLLICRSRCLCGPTGTHRFVAHEHRRREPSVAGAAWLTLEIFCHLARYASERLRFHVYRFLIALSVRPTKCFEISDHLVPSSETHATISASSSTVQPPFFTSELLSFFHRSRHGAIAALLSRPPFDQLGNIRPVPLARLGHGHSTGSCSSISAIHLHHWVAPPRILLRDAGDDEAAAAAAARAAAAAAAAAVAAAAAARTAAARRSQVCRRACPARARTTPTGRGGTALGRPGRGAPAARTPRPANSLSAVRVRGRRVVVKDVGVRPPNDGQAAADE